MRLTTCLLVAASVGGFCLLASTPSARGTAADGGAVHPPFALQFDYGDGTWEGSPQTNKDVFRMRVVGTLGTVGTWFEVGARFVCDDPAYHTSYPGRSFYQSPTDVIELSQVGGYGTHPDYLLGQADLDQFDSEILDPNFSDPDIVSRTAMPAFRVPGGFASETVWDAGYHRLSGPSKTFWKGVQASPGFNTEWINIELLARQCAREQWPGPLPSKYFLSQEWEDLMDGAFDAEIVFQVRSRQDDQVVSMDFPLSDPVSAAHPAAFDTWVANPPPATPTPPILNTSEADIAAMTGFAYNRGNGILAVIPWVASPTMPYAGGDTFSYRMTGMRTEAKALLRYPGGYMEWIWVDDVSGPHAQIIVPNVPETGQFRIVAVRNGNQTPVDIAPDEQPRFHKVL